MRGPKRVPERREHTGAASADRMQAVPSEIVSLLKRCPFIVGRLVTVTFAAFTTKLVYHRLGVPAACMVVRQSEDAGILTEILATTHDEKSALPLQCSADGTFDLWFYPRASRPVDAATGQSR